MSNIKDVVIPEGWEKIILGNIVNFYKGKGLPKKDIIDGGKYKCIHYGELFTTYKEEIKNIKSTTNNNKETFLSKKNDVLMPTSDVTPNGLARASSINENNIILGGDILIIRNNQNNLLGNYLSYNINYDKTQVMRLVKGSTVYHLYASDMERFSFFLPKSLQEQKKIAGILSTVDEVIEKTDSLIEKYKKIKTGLMEDLFTKGIDLNTGKPHTKFKDSELGMIPECWETDFIGNVSNVKAGPFGSEIKITDKINNGFRVYNQKTVIQKDFDIDKFYISHNKFNSLKGFEIYPSDILITSRGTIGKVIIFPEGEERGILHPCLIKISCNKNIVLPEFLSLLLSGDYLIHQISLQNSVTTIGVIYGGNLKVIKFKIPNIKEQKKIVGILSEADNKIEKEVAYKEKLEKIKKGLMNDLLTGKVIVKY